MPGIGNLGRSWRSIFKTLGHQTIVGEQSTLKVLVKHTANGSHRQSSFNYIMREKACKFETTSGYQAPIDSCLIHTVCVSCGIEPQCPEGTHSREAAVLLKAAWTSVRYSTHSYLKTRLRECVSSAALSSSAKRQAASRKKRPVETGSFACTQLLLRATWGKRYPVGTG